MDGTRPSGSRRARRWPPLLCGLSDDTSTGVMNFMAAREVKHSPIVEQAEDEIAAINMAIGASYAGVRSMTGTALRAVSR